MARVLRAVYDLLSSDQRRRAAVLLLLMLATAAFELIGIGSVLPFLSIAMDPTIIHRNEVLSWAYMSFGFSSDTTFILFGGLVMLAIIIVMNLVSAFTLWVQTRFVQGLSHSISVRLMGLYLAKPYTYFLAHNTSELGKNVLAESLRVVRGVFRPGTTLVSRSMLVVAVVGLLAAVEPAVTTMSILVIGGANVVVYLVIRKKVQRLGRKSVEANRLRFQTNAEAFGGIKEIQALGREAHFLRSFEAASSRFTTYQARNGIYSAMPRFLIQTIAFCGIIIGFMWVVGSGRDLSSIVPLMAFFAVAALRLLPRTQEILAALTEFRFNEHLLLKIHSDLVAATGRDGPELALVAPSNHARALPFDRVIRLEGVRFRYPATKRDVIGNLTLEIPKNAAIALVGATGAGKTTVADIILGLLVPDEGDLTVDGTTVTPKNIAGWRKRVGYVPQDVFLTDSTVARNIAFGFDDSEIDHEAVWKAASIAHIHDFILGDLPEGYDTMIGERGVRISGGQRQRIGIARALYNDPDVLIFDEATSDIDNVTEAHITEALQGLTGRKTLIIVAHRLTTIRRCDRIFLLESGAIVASGNYDELVATSTGFQRLARVSREAAIQ